MANDDYHVIVYRFLSYLYACLKKGIRTDPKTFERGGPVFGWIPESYMRFVYKTLKEEKFISGLSVEWYEDDMHVEGLEYMSITPLGIEYLTDNSLMERVKRFMKDIKATTPGM